MIVETSKEMAERMVRSGYIQENEAAEMESVLESFIKVKGAANVSEGVSRVMNRPVRSPIGYLKVTLSKMPNAAPKPEPAAKAGNGSADETIPGFPEWDQMGEAEQRAYIEHLLEGIYGDADPAARPAAYSPAPEEQIEAEIAQEEEEARRRAAVAETWAGDGLAEAMANRTESAYVIEHWDPYVGMLDIRYRYHSWATIRKLAIEEGTSMHEECRKLGLEYSKLIFNGFGREPVERKGAE